MSDENKYLDKEIVKFVECFRLTVDSQINKIDELIIKYQGESGHYNDDSISKSEFKNAITTEIKDVDIISQSIKKFLDKYENEILEPTILNLKSNCNDNKVYENDLDFNQQVIIPYINSKQNGYRDFSISYQ